MQYVKVITVQYFSLAGHDIRIDEFAAGLWRFGMLRPKNLA